MGRDRSLDEFLEAGDGDGDGVETDIAGDAASGDGGDPPAGEAESADERGSDGSPTDLEVRPAAPTMAWAAGGADCEACGRTAERRWRDGDRMVCGACKEW